MQVAIHQKQQLAQSTTGAALLSQYLSDKRASLTTVQSYKTYESNLKQFFSYLMATGLKLREVDQNTIIEYRDSMQELSPYTANNYLEAVKYFYKWLEGKGIINVAKNVVPYKITKRFTKELIEVDQVRNVYAYLNMQVQSNEGNKKQYLTALRNLVIFDFTLKTGLRTMSLVNIRIEDMDSKKGRGIVKYAQKGKRDKAFTILEPSTIMRVNKYLKERGEVTPESFLFVSHSNKVSGKQLSTKTIRYEMRKTFDAVGLLDQLNNDKKKKYKITAHSLRHTFLTMIAKHKGVIAAQREAGHASIDTTNLYLKYLEDDERFEDRANLDNIFEG